MIPPPHPADKTHGVAPPSAQPGYPRPTAQPQIHRPARYSVSPAAEFPPRPDGGGHTYELPLGLESLPATSAYVFGRRAPNTVSGRHYHRGHSPSKAPEIFLLLSGRAIWRFADLVPDPSSLVSYPWTGTATQRIPTIEAVAVEGPCVVKIWPGVWHELRATTAIEFLELNSIGDHAADTFTDWQPAPPP